MVLGIAARRALRGMRRHVLLQLAAIGVMTIAIGISGFGLLVALNAARLTTHWGTGMHLVVYLRHDVTSARGQALLHRLERRQEIASIRWVAPEAARIRLSHALGARAGVLDGLETDFFPPSLEIQLSGARTTTGPLIALLESLPEVDEVDRLGMWAERLGQVATVARTGLLALAVLLGLCGLVVVVSTSRLGLLARREELETLKLLGATRGFLNAPFLIQGLIHGVISALLASLALYVLFAALVPLLADGLSPLLGGLPLEFLSLGQLALGIVVGASVGLVGSRLALIASGEP